VFRSRKILLLLGLAACSRPHLLSPDPWIGLSTEHVSLRHAVGVGHAPGQTVTIRNAGGYPFGIPRISLQYLEPAGAWLDAQLDGDGTTYQLTLRPRNPEAGPLALGTYHAKVEISADKAANAPVFVDVLDEVVPEQIVARPPAISVTAALGGKAWLPALRIEEALAGELPEPDFAVALPEGQSWLRLGTPSLAWSERDGADYWDPGLQLDTAPLAAGEYQATLSATSAGVGSVAVPVALTVNEWGETPADDAPGFSPYCPHPLALADGRMLCAGARPWTFDPGTGRWRELDPYRSSLPVRLTTVLEGGNVLFVHQGSICTIIHCTEQASWALLDPAAGAWVNSGDLPGEQGATATPLADGRVLLTGHIQGTTGGNPDEYQPSRSSAVLDPVPGTLVKTASMGFPHQHAAAVRLADGRVLLAGGVSTSRWEASAEIFDPGTGSWKATGSLRTPRADFSLAVLPDGRVLAAGGQNDGGVLASAELFDPGTGTWAAAGSMASPRCMFGNLLRLPDGTLLATGGLGWDFVPIPWTERYDPGASQWFPWAVLPGARFLHRAALLEGSWVLVLGGESGDAAAGVVRRTAP
jgi:hypothetical protein